MKNLIILSLLTTWLFSSAETLMKGANKAVSRGQYSLALKMYKKALEIGANPAVTHYNMANIYFRMEKIPEAIENYKKTIDLAPLFKNAYLNMAKINYQYEEFYNAIQICKDYLEFNEFDVETMVLIAAIYRQTRNFIQAEKYLERARENDPYYEDIYFEYADLYYQLGDNDKALKWVKEGIRAVPDSLYLREQEARFYFEKKNYKNAVNIYLSILRQFTNINKEQAYIYMIDAADCFINDDLINSAMIQLQDAINFYPEGESAFYSLNVLFADTGRTLEAIDFYREIFPKNPKIARLMVKELFNLAYNQNNKTYILQFIKLYEELGLSDELYKYVKEEY